MKGAKVAALFVALCLSHGAFGQERQFNLPAMDAVHGIPEFARQAGIQIVAPADDLGGVATPAIRGNLDVRVALTKLLAGTGLEIASDDGAIITLRRRAKSTNQSGGPNDTNKQRLKSETDTGTSDSIDSSGSRGLSEIIVTAQKRSERLIDVPAPITVLSSETLTRSNQVRIQDFYNSVPGLNYSGGTAGEANLSIRGLTTGGQTNPTVGILIDDVPINGSSALTDSSTLIPDIDPSNVAQIEVLRGPQGTLYGASTLGGLIRYVTVDPSTDQLSGRIEATSDRISNASKWGYGARGVINVPIDDQLAVRLSAFGRFDPGYINDSFLHEKGINRDTSSGFTAAAKWTPSDAFSLKLSVLQQQITSPNFSDAGPLLSTSSGFGRALDQNFLPGTGAWSTHEHLYTAVIKAALGAGIELTSVTGYNVHSDMQTVDFSGFAPDNVLIRIGETKKITQELRLNGKAGSVDWLVGSFYTHEDSPADEPIVQWNPATQSQQPVNPSTGAFLAPGSSFNGNLWDENFPTTFSEISAFADATIHFTDQLDLQVGGRESTNRQKFSEVDTGPQVLSDDGFPPPVVFPTIRSKNSSFTYLVTPEYKFSPNLMTYARFASGYRPGGPNANVSFLQLIGIFGVPTEYGPDRTQNYELGIKGDLIDHKLSFDASVYYIKWSDVQIAEVVNSNGFTGNAGGAKSEGVEWSVQARPFDNFTVNAWAAYNEAVLTQSLPPKTSIGAAGDRLPFGTRWSGNLAAQQKFPINAESSSFFGASLAYVGDRLGAFPAASKHPQPRITLPSYTQLNLQAGVDWRQWTTTAFANNVADRRGVLARSVFAYPTENTTYIQPRTIGVSVARRF